MTKLTLEIKMNGAAFDNEFEVVRLIENVAEKIGLGYLDGVIMDANGNRAGKYKIK